MCTPPRDYLRFSNTTGILQKKKTMWFIVVEVEQETSAPPPKKTLDPPLYIFFFFGGQVHTLYMPTLKCLSFPPLLADQDMANIPVSYNP